VDMVEGESLGVLEVELCGGGRLVGLALKVK